MQVKRMMIAATAVAATAGLAACSSGSTGSSDSGSANSSAMPSASSSPAAAAQFGPACGQVPASGAGSFQGMAQAPVATAASSNPLLSTLVSAVQKANLVDTLNSAQGITVFAPDNDAFSKIPKADLDKVLADNATLSKILQYHVVPQTITPAQLTSGDFKTLEGASVKTTGSGDNVTVNGSSKVVCGNVQTANATVYIIDGVLMPS
jgi:uncharacterized surface protein with fasciclin (FAS1) repeats